MAACAVLVEACATNRPETESNVVACVALGNRLSDQQQALVARMRQIRSQHVMLQDYDRQMIAAITEGRAAVQATKLTELSVEDEIDGCSGPQLEELRRRAQAELANLRDLLADLNRALRHDPDGVFIDEP